MKPSRRTYSTAAGGQVITFVLPGDPPGKPRQTRRDKWAKRPCVLRYRAWADALRAVAGQLPTQAPEHVDVYASFALPLSWPRARREEAEGEPHRTKPDFDNVLKSVADALWPVDDSFVSSASIEATWAVEGQDGSVTVAIEYAPTKKARARKASAR